MHALVIEDDPITAMMIEDELFALGYASVDTAATEDEAILSVANRRPDLITSDGSLIQGSGLSAVRRIRSCFSVPVIFITADPESARLLHPEARVIAKPFSTSQLWTAVELSQHSAAAQL